MKRVCGRFEKLELVPLTAVVDWAYRFCHPGFYRYPIRTGMELRDASFSMEREPRWVESLYVLVLMPSTRSVQIEGALQPGLNFSLAPKLDWEGADSGGAFCPDEGCGLMSDRHPCFRQTGEVGGYTNNSRPTFGLGRRGQALKPL